jgi:hypothetical protein
MLGSRAEHPAVPRPGLVNVAELGADELVRRRVDHDREASLAFKAGVLTGRIHDLKAALSPLVRVGDVASDAVELVATVRR